MKNKKILFEMAAKMLDIAADSFSNHGCNDMILPLDKLEFVKEMIAESDYPDGDPNVDFKRCKIYVMDTEVMRYCQHQLEKLAEVEK